MGNSPILAFSVIGLWLVGGGVVGTGYGIIALHDLHGATMYLSLGILQGLFGGVLGAVMVYRLRQRDQLFSFRVATIVGLVSTVPILALWIFVASADNSPDIWRVDFVLFPFVGAALLTYSIRAIANLHLRKSIEGFK
jgi:peptidoglycan/LPS O-acetylase OafA/YrhL